ncbi:unnamed protein product [marine sediment metagenome]|uniref:Uncharacterized protein n=1 Tax=marine sediment metagenome TaxID=412755 RepID=X1BDJ9_9ZZZZ
MRTPHHYLYDLVKREGMTLEDYVGSGVSLELSNGQTKSLAGVPWHDVPWEDVDLPPDMLQIAKENLRNRFVVVGLTEKFDESLLLMKQRFGWRDIFYTRQEVTAKRPPKSAIPPSTLRIIEEKNNQDMELYAFAKQLLEEQISNEGPSFERRVKLFRLLHGAYLAVRGPWIRRRSHNLAYKLRHL